MAVEILYKILYKLYCEELNLLQLGYEPNHKTISDMNDLANAIYLLKWDRVDKQWYIDLVHHFTLKHPNLLD